MVSAVTASAKSVLCGAWLKPGAHVNLVGSHLPTEREADTETILRSKVYVDVVENALREAGDLLIPIGEGAFTADRIVGEIGQLAAKEIAGRESDSEITLFKSLGHAAQDVHAANAVYARAVAAGRGATVEI